MRMRILTAALMLLVSASLFAQTQRTFVSFSGLDTNPCSRQLPCRNFGAAITAVAPGGEVVALDSAGYGPVTIQKSVSIISPSGVYGAITAFAGNAVVVNAPGIRVVLRGLYLNGLGGQDAIEFADGSFLNVENVTANGFNGSGLFVHAASARFAVRDAQFRENGFGIFLADATSLEGAIDRARLDNNSSGGLTVGNNGKVTVRDSVFFNDDPAVKMSGSTSEASLENCFISALFNGIQGDALSGNAVVRLSSTTIVDTVNAMTKSGNPGNNTFISFGNNRFHGNGSDGTFDSTVLLK